MAQTKTIKFFISSTFKDFEQERDILHKFVFPKLKKLCQKNNFGFQPIDLRWGVMEEAGYDQQTMNICLNEIRRSSHEPKPNLLLLVGQRYGWVPLPYGIEENEFQKILKKVSTKVKDGFKKSDKELIQEWYRIDKNAIPATRYLKDKSKFKGKDKRDEWTAIENQIKAAFQKATKDKKYHTSATEQEMAEGLDAFDSKESHQHTFAYFRTITEYKNVDDKIKNDFIDEDLNKLKALSEKLQKNSNIPKDNQIILDAVKWSSILEARKTNYEKLTLKDAPKYLKKFHDAILEKFTESITKEIDLYNNKNISKLKIELEEQKKFKTRRAKTVIGRNREIIQIKQFIENPNQQYYLLYGKSGSGKSSVIAKAICYLTHKKSKHKLQDNYHIIYRFIGTSALSTYSRVLFESLYWQIEYLLQDDNKYEKIIKKESLNLEYEEHEFKKQFQKQLKKLVDKNKKVVIFLDALDQFEDYNDLSILLDDLPENVKIVFSTLYDEKKREEENSEDYYRYYNRLEDIVNKQKELGTLDQTDQLKILKQWLDEKNRTLTKKQFEDIEKMIKQINITPLHLKLIFEIVKHWSSETIDFHLQESEEKLIIQFFNLIQKQYHHEKPFMEKILGFISASKDGLSEEEIIDLISKDNVLELFQNDRYQKLDKLPPAIWSRFYYYIEDIFTEKLIDGEMLITPFHRVIAETIKKNYYDKNALSLHKKLACHFLTLEDKTQVWDKRYNNLHMLSETPYQLFKAKKSRCLKKILFDLEFAGSVYDNHKQESFRHIMERASKLEGISEDEMYVWESFYREKEHLILKVDEEMWRPHQSLFQLAYEDGEDSQIHIMAYKLIDKNKIPFIWMRRRNKQKKFKRNKLLKVIYLHQEEIENIKILEDGRVLSYSENTLKILNNYNENFIIVHRHTDIITGTQLLKDGQIVSWSNSGIIKIWNYDQFTSLEGHLFDITAIDVLNDGRLISSGWDKTLRIWDKNKKCIVLKGHSNSIIGIKLLKDGRIISYSKDNTLRIWNSDNKNSIVLQGHFNFVRGADILLDGRIVSWSDDLTIHIWNKNNIHSNILKGHKDLINGIKILEDGKIISWSDDSTIRIWNSFKLDSIVFEGHTDAVKGIKVLKNGTILSYSSDNTIRLWNRTTNNSIIFQGHTRGIRGLRVFNNEKNIISWSDDATIRIWNLDGETIDVYEGHTGSIYDVKIIKNTKILSYAEDNTLRLWSLSKIPLKLGTSNEHHTNSINNIKILNDERILSYSKDNTLRLWDKNANSSIVLKGHTDEVINAELLKNNQILSLSYDLTLRLWDINSKKSIILKDNKAFEFMKKLSNNPTILSQYNNFFLEKIYLARENIDRFYIKNSLFIGISDKYLLLYDFFYATQIITIEKLFKLHNFPKK